MSMVGWHYTVYGIALYGESGELAANRYTNELIFREERGRLIGEAGIPALDIRFAVLAARGSQDESIYFYPLEAPIQKVVLEELGRLPPEERAWWEALLCKRLGNRTDAAVSAADLRRAAAQLSAVIPGEEARRGIIALKRLAEMSDPVCVVSDAAYDSFAKQKLGTPSDSIYYMDHYLRTHSKA